MRIVSGLTRFYCIQAVIQNVLSWCRGCYEIVCKAKLVNIKRHRQRIITLDYPPIQILYEWVTENDYTRVRRNINVLSPVKKFAVAYTE